MSAQEAEQVVDAFIAAMEAADADAVAALLHPDIEIGYNFMPSVGKDQFIAMQRIVDRAASRKLTVIERHAIEGRVIQRHQLRLAPHAGEASLIDAVLFMTVENGLLTEMREYLDSAQLNPDILKEDADTPAE